MAKAADPLVINFFATGLYTHRSQLFSPYRTLGVNVVTYHDAAIDGQDMEIGSSLQWRRRPGFARFCSVPFAGGEFPLQFYSARQPSGTVVAFVDTNQNFSTFTPSAIHQLFTKTTTAQGFIQQVGQTTYYANGVDIKKWNGTYVTGWGTAAPTTAPGPNGPLASHAPGFWSSGEAVNPGAFVVDSNGNIQMALSGGTTGVVEPLWNIGAGTALNPTLGTAPTTDGNLSWFCVGSVATAVWLPGTVINGTLVIGGVTESGVVIDSNGNLQQITVIGTTGAAPPTWNLSVGGNTTDNSVTWINRGPAALSVQSGYIYAFGFRTIYGHLSTLSPLYLVGAVMGPRSIPLAGVGTTDLTQCNQTIHVSGNTSVTNNVLSLPVSLGLGPVLLTGQVYVLSGFTGGLAPLNTHTVLVTAINGSILTCVFVDGFTTANLGPSPQLAFGDFCGVEIYRTADGGGILYYAAAIVNTGAAVWTYTDTLPDSGLATSLIGPLAHLNDPPPGTPGSLIATGGTILAYWQGRVWMAVGNKLYFTAGLDCINGVPEESWPPANNFQYPGPIAGLSPTSAGLLVWGADYVSMALGGPQTLSFFPYDLMKNFGVSSPNCIAQDGDTISVITTQGQCFTLDLSGKSETGNYIVNLLSGFLPQSSYVTTHRSGTDAGLWLGDGSANAFRYSLNMGAWSTRCVPVGGMRAIKSIETSVGVTTLCAGRATGAGYILGRSLSTWQDDGQNYPNAFVTIGSIVLTQPGSNLAQVQHIVGYFDAVGLLGPTLTAPTGGPTIPTIAILPNEIAASPGPGFLTLSQPKSEYTTANPPSQSLLSLRWDVDSMSVTSLVSQWMHHLQIRISWPPENAPNTIKTLAIMFEKDK